MSVSTSFNRKLSMHLEGRPKNKTKPNKQKNAFSYPKGKILTNKWPEKWLFLREKYDTSVFHGLRGQRHKRKT